MDRKVNFDYSRSFIKVTQYTTADRGGSAVGPRRTGERDCRELRRILRGSKRAGEQKPIYFTVILKGYNSVSTSIRCWHHGVSEARYSNEQFGI